MAYTKIDNNTIAISGDQPSGVIYISDLQSEIESLQQRIDNSDTTTTQSFVDTIMNEAQAEIDMENNRLLGIKNRLIHIIQDKKEFLNFLNNL